MSREVAEFLTTRRARVTPAQVGLPEGHNRRVPGLRRSEVATLAGVSVEYYTRIERGNISGVSPEIIDALARALLLDDAERSHLFDLAEAESPVSRRTTRTRRARARGVHPGLQWVLDGFTGGAAFVRNDRMDIVAANALARAFYSGVYALPEPNIARYVFLDPEAKEFHPEWDAIAATTAAILRTEAGRNPHDRTMQDLVGELSTRSEEFRRLWAGHDVRIHGTGVKHFRHPEVGDLELTYESLPLDAEPGLNMTVYVAEPGSASEERLRLLASLAAEDRVGLT